MYAFTILRSSPKALASFKDVLDPKGPNLNLKQPKMGGVRFFLILNLNFQKEDYKNSL